MALAKTLERNPSAKARQSFVTQMRNKFPDAPIRKKDSPTVAIEKALDTADEEPARARKPTKRARNGRRSSSTKRAVAAVKKRARRHMRRVLLGIVALLGAVGVGVAVRGKVKELEGELSKEATEKNKVLGELSKAKTEKAKYDNLVNALGSAVKKKKQGNLEQTIKDLQADLQTEKVRVAQTPIQKGVLELKNRVSDSSGRIRYPFKNTLWVKVLCTVEHDRSLTILIVDKNREMKFKEDEYTVCKFNDNKTSDKKKRFNIKTTTNTYGLEFRVRPEEYGKWVKQTNYNNKIQNIF